MRSKDTVSSQGSVHTLNMAGGETFEIPGVRGRMERLAFPSGIVLFRLEYEALDDCFLQMQGAFDEPWVGSALHIQGRSELICPNGDRYSFNPETAMLMRVDQHGSRFRLYKGQIVRHIGAASTLSSLRQRFGGSLPAILQEFESPYGDSCHLRAQPPSSRLRQLASGLFSQQANGVCRELKLEAIANLFLAEVIEGLEGLGETPHNETLPLWEEQAYHDVLEQVRNHLDTPLSIPALADQAGITENRLDQVFKLKHDQTCAEFIRNERMTLAQRLLETGDHPVKVVADKVGYAHVSNFSRAYRSHFGETPARTLRRAATK
ncbi:AraC family transcriptional regulator [Alcanivorax sp.]|uniref:AraC family transcriptional regulator n=1 Tax=Alcanivorax sp. TaxID=1872427 RepID=UPI000C3B66E8|nr:AraC family transcriptional regulator [Alcanivorax sp.]MBB10362.1 AraC family transcriptional regulator [Alcanivorax sp.]MBU83494.1 AraC family transcriptional regulator [Alcanivorax sp.]